MTTQRQINANRRNAKRSTGPATEAGRARSSRNALKHGLTAREFTIDEREANALAAFLDDIVEVLGPVGALEDELAQRVALCSWRLRRIARLEVTKTVRFDVLPIGELNQEKRHLYEYMADGLCDSLIRCETSIDRMRQSALRDLERLQAQRRGELVPAPIVMDVTHTMDVRAPATSSGRDAGESRAEAAPASVVVDVADAMDVGASAEPVTSTEAGESRAAAVPEPIAMGGTHTTDVGANGEPLTSTGGRRRPEPSDMEPGL
jgi:hypothetical protein